MAATPGGKRPPVHRLAWAGFGLALVALVLSLYGGLGAENHLAGSPLREARGSAGLPAGGGRWWDRAWASGEKSLFGERLDRVILDATTRSRTANVSLQVVAFVLPLALGLAAALAGGHAMTLIERAGGRYRGNFQAVMAVMVGGFAAVAGGVMCLSVFVWPHLPSLYT